MKPIAPPTLLMAVAFTLLCFQSVTFAQKSDDWRTAFLSGATVATSIDGVRAFPDWPKGFNPLTATDRELGTYGLPERPDQSTSPKEYAVWERGMLAIKTHARDLRALAIHSTEPVPQKSVEAPDLQTQGTGPQWNGIEVTNKLTKWSDKTSFNKISSVWNVPTALPPFNACANGVTGPFIEVTWNGISGEGGSTLVQGGSYGSADCGGSPVYLGWIEWFPSYPLLPITCPNNLYCPVSPGDDFYVITYGAAGTSTQNIYVEDVTQQWEGTYALAWMTGPGITGNAAEWVVERPCCTAQGDQIPLSNYIYEFMDDCVASDGAGTEFYPGSTSASVTNITMVADNLSTPISFATVGTSGDQGKYSIWFADENCAYSGGCAP